MRGGEKERSKIEKDGKLQEGSESEGSSSLGRGAIFFWAFYFILSARLVSSLSPLCVSDS